MSSHAAATQLAIYTEAFTHAAPLEQIVGDVVRLATFAIMLGSRAALPYPCQVRVADNPDMVNN
jgi:hypothetical protein